MSTNAFDNDVVWGAAEIGRVIGKTERAVFHLLESEQLPARKVGGRWCAKRSRLLAFLDSED